MAQIWIWSGPKVQSNPPCLSHKPIKSLGLNAPHKHHHPPYASWWGNSTSKVQTGATRPFTHQIPPTTKPSKLWQVVADLDKHHKRGEFGGKSKDELLKHCEDTLLETCRITAGEGTIEELWDEVSLSLSLTLNMSPDPDPDPDPRPLDAYHSTLVCSI